jgi:hypothetical protein
MEKRKAVLIRAKAKGGGFSLWDDAGLALHMEKRQVTDISKSYLKERMKKPACGKGAKVMTTRLRRCLFSFALILLMMSCEAPSAQDFRNFDPSGQWKSMHGVLSLMLAGDALSFSYSAVFGATGHICDGVGVAGLWKNGEYHYVDEHGTLAIVVDENGVRMQTEAGIVSFCGASWPGDLFTPQGYEPVTRCVVSETKAYFHVVMRNPPDRRKGYVLKGDVVETAPACFEGGDDWIFARFRGRQITTAGLLHRDALQCDP